VAATGFPHQNLHPNRWRSTSDAPSVRKASAYIAVARISAITILPPGLRTRKPSLIARFRIGIRSDVVYREARNRQIKSSVREWERSHVGGLDVHAIADPFQRRVAQGDVHRIARLVRCTPDIHACHSACRQPACDGRQDCAPTAPHIEHHLVAARVRSVQNTVPLDELATSGGIEKAGGVCRNRTKYSVIGAAA